MKNKRKALRERRPPPRILAIYKWQQQSVTVRCIKCCHQSILKELPPARFDPVPSKLPVKHTNHYTMTAIG